MSDSLSAFLTSAPIATLAGASIVLALTGLGAYAIVTSRRLQGSSLFNRLFVVVAASSGFFSAVSSAIGFGLITSQEAGDFFRNAVLPPAFGVFVFALSVAIWIGGAELVRHRDWFRSLKGGGLGDAVFFFERAFKLFVVIPALAAILFLVSTWTTVVGIGGVDAVRYTYASEVERLQAECAGVSQWRQRDFLFREDLRLSVADVTRAATNEREGGARTGAAGRGAVTDYISGVADWYAGLGGAVEAILEAPDPSGVSPHDPEICSATSDSLKRLLAANAYDNYDAWARRFESAFNDFAVALNRWRRDKRIETLLDQQLANFNRANPKPVAGAGGLTAAQGHAIDAYAEDVEAALKTLIRKQRAVKPPAPLASAAEQAPERGAEIFLAPFRTPAPAAEVERKARTQAVVDAETIPALSVITPRDAVLKNAQVFSDVWALALAWDYAAYILMLAYLFFPSAERAAGYKDRE